MNLTRPWAVLATVSIMVALLVLPEWDWLVDLGACALLVATGQVIWGYLRGQRLVWAPRQDTPK